MVSHKPLASEENINKLMVYILVLTNYYLKNPEPSSSENDALKCYLECLLIRAG